MSGNDHLKATAVTRRLSFRTRPVYGVAKWCALEGMSAFFWRDGESSIEVSKTLETTTSPTPVQLALIEKFKNENARASRVLEGTGHE